MDFANCYQDEDYAAAYARLEFPGTYYLAFRDLPQLIRKHVAGRRALDFGCGTGRSTRFLAGLGFEAVGADIAPEMIRHARASDPAGDYRLVQGADLSQFADSAFDLVLAAFTFDNTPTRERKVALFTELRRVLSHSGRIINLVSSPEMYWNEWASMTTKDFAERNRQASCGDEVRIIVTALKDHRPAVDILWPEDAYHDVYAASGLKAVEIYRPLGRPEEPYQWVSEEKVAPWTIYMLAPADDGHRVP